MNDEDRPNPVAAKGPAVSVFSGEVRSVLYLQQQIATIHSFLAEL